MKKLLSLLLVLCLLSGLLISCDTQDTTDDGTTETPTGVITEAPVKDSTEKPTEVITETPVQTEQADKTPTESSKPQKIGVSTISFDKSSYNLKVGDVIMIRATITPSNATDKILTWTSSDTSVVSVMSMTSQSAAKITARAEGTVILTATAPNGVSKTCRIYVESAGGTEDIPDAPSEPVVDIPNTVTGNRYAGETFTIYSVEDMFAKKYFFADKTTGDGMNDALYRRQQKIELALAVDLEYQAAEGPNGEMAYQIYATEVQNAIKAGDEKYQLVLTHAYYAIPDLITMHSLKDFSVLTSTNLCASYWNKDIMDEVSYKGNYYLGYSDFNLANTYVIAFNKTLYNTYSSAFEGNTMYDYVDNNQWTLAKMEEVAALVYEDRGDVTQNIYGLTGELWVPFCGFIQSSGERIVTRGEDGEYSVSWRWNTQKKNKMVSLVTKLQATRDMEETLFWLHPAFNEGISPTKVTIESGRAFMQLMNTSDLTDLQNTNVKFGVVPYPMYDEDQANTGGYQSLNWAGYLAVPSNVSNNDMVGDVLECYAYYSEPVTEYYYEKLLGFKVSDAPDDARMLDVIWDSLCVDFGVTYEGFGMSGGINNLDMLVYTVPYCLINDQSFASHNSRYGSAANNALDRKINNG